MMDTLRPFCREVHVVEMRQGSGDGSVNETTTSNLKVLANHMEG